MGDISLLFRLALAVVFAFAGTTKLFDLTGERKALGDFGLPSWLARPAAILLPIAELITAILLIPAATALWGGISASLLLLAFTVGISANLLRGKTPDCHCFGQLSTTPISWKTILRNLTMAGGAGFIVWHGATFGNSSFLARIQDLSASELALAIGSCVTVVILGLLSWVIVHLFRQNGRLMVRMEALEQKFSGEVGGVVVSPQLGLPVGVDAPDFELASLSGSTRSLTSLLSAKLPVVLLFTDPGCGPCNALMPDVLRWQGEHQEKLTIALISRGTQEENAAKFPEEISANVLLQEDREIAETYRVYGTPMAVVVDLDGKVESPAAGGAEAIGRLIDRLVTVGTFSVTEITGNQILEGNGLASTDLRMAGAASDGT